MSEKTSPPKSPRAPAKRPSASKAPAADKAAPEGDRIAKVLSRAGVASRREAERLIEAGEVKVNGKLVTSPALNIGPKDRITVSGKPVGAPEPARLWLYYKPEGLVTSASDEKGRDTVFDHLPEDMPRVMSVGRLDLNSEGLLLLTNDGELKRQLELPSTGWLRKYRVRIRGNPAEQTLDVLRQGIDVDGETFQPMEVTLDRHQGVNAWLTIGLREGKNREIRRAMMAIGFTVNRLIRVSYGPFRLNDLQPGQVEEVRARVLRDQLGAMLGDAPAGAEAAPRSAPRGGAKDGGKPSVRHYSKSADVENAPRRAPRARKPISSWEDEAPAKPRGPRPAPRKSGYEDQGPRPSAPKAHRSAAPDAKPRSAKPAPARSGYDEHEARPARKFAAKSDRSSVTEANPRGAKPTGAARPTEGKSFASGPRKSHGAGDAAAPRRAPSGRPAAPKDGPKRPPRSRG